MLCRRITNETIIARTGVFGMTVDAVDAK